MRLKSLEIKGFKSFADKTVINFDEKITGVVGPNGCGKSNIVDSIRWVIGEHKIANLRSENLEGLVFNGSKGRSASGLAEVSLTFDNTRNVLPTEFTTVTITRKFFKNGESEYRLNDVSCRLKDIHNLLMDTGVSPDSYSIIELGMVDDLIGDKDNSRRRMLEQAAGISIYKTRRKEAALKLEATAADLNRIEDLLFEISHNLNTLESQARKAERYNEIKREYREISIELAKATLEGFNLSYRDLTSQQETASIRKMQMDAEMATDEAALEQDKFTLATQEQELQDTQKLFNELVTIIQVAESEKNLSAQQISYLRERETELKELLVKAGVQQEILETNAGIARLQLAGEQQELSKIHTTLQTLQVRSSVCKQDYTQRKKEMDDLRMELSGMQRRQFESEKTEAVAESSIQNLQLGIRQSIQEQTQQSEQIRLLEGEKSILDNEILERSTDLEHLQEIWQQTRNDMLDSQATMESIREQMTGENRTLDARKNEYDLLKSMVENLEGYPDSMKFLNRSPDWDNRAPILSEVISCPEQYRPAIETLLEPYLNYYLVPTAADAIRAISLLDDHKKGKASFFILDRFAAGDFPSVAAPGGTIPALELVDLEERYRNLGQYLLGKVFIAEDQEALDVDPGDLVIVEKSGRSYRGHYQIQGGSVGLFEGKKLGRTRHLEKLQAEIQELTARVNHLKTRLEEKNGEITGYHNQLNVQQLEQGRELLNQQQNRQHILSGKLENFHQLLEGSSARITAMQLQLENDQLNLTLISKELAVLNRQLGDLHLGLSVAEGLFHEAEQEFNRASEQFNAETLRDVHQQSKVLALNQEIEFITRQSEELQQQINSNEQQLQQTLDNINEAELKLELTENSLLELYRQRDADETALNEADRKYYQFRNQVSDAESAIRLKQRTREQAEQILVVIREKTGELKLQLAAMKERLNLEFRVVLDDILDQPRIGAVSVEELQTGADKFKKRLENMGEINPTAIEAFQEMTKRHDFIVTQRNDLVAAKQSLMTTINEVEASANRKFLDTFNQVKENFIRVFKALFTQEDQCDLILSDPANLAETGIEIIAQPKGKKPTVINQLSGGEKTLTATALLFSIYLIKPAPFCILDEVDAPLDDVNVGKFTNMIRQFSENSQFIIVTHNKQTMAAVDVIYGVTMQEAGVSRLVPVDFRSLN